MIATNQGSLNRRNLVGQPGNPGGENLSSVSKGLNTFSGGNQPGAPSTPTPYSSQDSQNNRQSTTLAAGLQNLTLTGADRRVPLHQPWKLQQGPGRSHHRLQPQPGRSHRNVPWRLRPQRWCHGEPPGGEQHRRAEPGSGLRHLADSGPARWGREVCSPRWARVSICEPAISPCSPELHGQLPLGQARDQGEGILATGAHEGQIQQRRQQAGD